MIRITEREYLAIHPDSRGVWTSERTDWPNWEAERHKYMGKRTVMAGAFTGEICTLYVEGMGLGSIPDPTTPASA